MEKQIVFSLTQVKKNYNKTISPSVVEFNQTQEVPSSAGLNSTIQVHPFSKTNANNSFLYSVQQRRKATKGRNQRN